MTRINTRLPDRGKLSGLPLNHQADVTLEWVGIKRGYGWWTADRKRRMKAKTRISNGGYRVGIYLISTSFVIGFLFAKLDHIGMWGPRIKDKTRMRKVILLLLPLLARTFSFQNLICEVRCCQY